MFFRKIASAALFAPVFTAFAADIPVTQAPPVVVTATRFDEAAEHLPIGVQVITREDIRRSTATIVPDLLRQLAGIRTRDNSGSRDVQVDMRGFGAFGDQNTLILLDGVRISENEQAPVNWSAIPLEAIERIEIMRGSGAVLYGSGATGGTINIITRKPGENERSALVYGGVETYDTGEIRVGANLAGKDAGLRVNASHYQSDNYRDNNRVRQNNALVDMRWTGDGGRLGLTVGGDDQSLRLPGALNEAQIAANPRQAATPNDFTDRTSGYFNLNGGFKVGAADLAANLGYREKDIHASIIGFTTDIDMNVWSFSPRIRLPHRLGERENSLVAGFDWDDWSFVNQNVSPGGTTRRPDAFQRNRAFYFQNATELTPALGLSLGARQQTVEYGVVDQANPAQADSRKRDLSAYEVAARYRVNEGLSAYGKFGYSFRVPNVNDVYNLFSGVVALLEPQTSHDRELGLDIRSGAGTYRVAVYHMDLNNELFYDPLAFVNRNLPPTRRYGTELDGKWRITSTLDAFANYTYAVSKFREGSFGGVPVAGNPVPLVPRNAFNIGAGWTFAPRARADAVLRYVGEQSFDGDETNTYGRRIPAYTVVDLKLAYETQGWQLAAGVKNLFDEKYFTYGVYSPPFPPFFPADFFAYPAAERSLFVSAQYRFR